MGSSPKVKIGCSGLLKCIVYLVRSILCSILCIGLSVETAALVNVLCDTRPEHDSTRAVSSVITLLQTIENNSPPLIR